MKSLEQQAAECLQGLYIGEVERLYFEKQVAAALQSKQAELDAEKADVEKLMSEVLRLARECRRFEQQVQAEREALELSRKCCQLGAKFANETREELDATRAELDEALEALRPFANQARQQDLLTIPFGDSYIVGGVNGDFLTVGHCRQAAAIVEKHKKI